jgi:hypothetical protein
MQLIILADENIWTRRISEMNVFEDNLPSGANIRLLSFIRKSIN